MRAVGCREGDMESSQLAEWSFGKMVDDSSEAVGIWPHAKSACGGCDMVDWNKWNKGTQAILVSSDACMIAVAISTTLMLCR